MSNYQVNMDDKRLTSIEGEEKTAITSSDKTYDGMVSANKAKENQILAGIKKNQAAQEKIQNENTEFAIEQIEQQKEQANKDYIKEQSGAYVDWQKASDPYGANAEQVASQGLQNTGFAESSKVSMYNTYQNRVATARESYQRAVLNYNNSITQARLQNNAVLAEIAAEAFAKQMEVTLSFVQQNNAILTQKVASQLQIKQMYQTKWNAVLDELYKEMALKEQARQHDETIAEQKRQHDEKMALENEKFAWTKEQANKSSGGGSGGGGTINKDSSSDGGKIDKDESDEGVTDPNWIEPEAGGSKDVKPYDGGSIFPDYEIDTKSLADCGLAGASAATIEKEIKEGRLVEKVVNGKLVYRRVFNGSGGKNYYNPLK